MVLRGAIMTNDTTGKKTGWNILGPGGGGGQFIPTISPHDPDTMLVACDMTGSYITRDGGGTWRQFNLRSRVDSFAFDPVCPGRIYAGSTGLYRSSDWGEKWKLIYPDPASVIEERMAGDHADHAFISGDNWPGGDIQAISVDSAQNSHLFIGIRSKKDLFVFYSENEGKDWAELCSVKGAKIHTIFIDPCSPYDDRRLFIFSDAGITAISVKERLRKELKLPERINSIFHSACGSSAAAGAPSFYLTSRAEKGNQSRIWKSEDYGETWFELDVQIEGVLAGPETGMFPEYTLLAVP